MVNNEPILRSFYASGKKMNMQKNKEYSYYEENEAS